MASDPVPSDLPPGGRARALLFATHLFLLTLAILGLSVAFNLLPSLLLGTFIMLVGVIILAIPILSVGALFYLGTTSCGWWRDRRRTTREDLGRRPGKPLLMKSDGLPDAGRTAPDPLPQPEWYWTCRGCTRWNAPSSRTCMDCSSSYGEQGVPLG